MTNSETVPRLSGIAASLLLLLCTLAVLASPSTAQAESTSMTFESLGYNTATEPSFTLDFNSPYVEASGQLDLHFQNFITDGTSYGAYLTVFVNGAQVYSSGRCPEGVQWSSINLPTGVVNQGTNTLLLSFSRPYNDPPPATVYEDSSITLNEEVPAAGMTFESLGYNTATQASLTLDFTNPYIYAGGLLNLHFQNFITDGTSYGAYLTVFVNGAQVYSSGRCPEGVQWSSINLPTGVVNQGTNTLQLSFSRPYNDPPPATVYEDSSITLIQPPSQPRNIYPLDADTDVSITPTLRSSAFSDPDTGDTHAASQWQISAVSGSYSSPAFDSGTDLSNLISITVPSGKLQVSTTYYWRVRHQDNHGIWSDWSANTSFATTSSPNEPPSRPSNVTPISGAVNVSTTPTLQSSTFSDSDSGDTHAASQWQISAAWGSWSSPTFDSGTDITNLTQIAIPQGLLGFSTKYYWRIRHQDNHGAWSEWSSETSFTTSAPNRAPHTCSNVSPENAAVGTSWAPVLQSSAFSDPDSGDTHAASQWQIYAGSGGYSNPLLDSGTDVSHLTSFVVPSGTISSAGTYYWRTRHQDEHGDWSDWSSETWFTTKANANDPPTQPSNLLPIHGTSKLGLTPNLRSSSFSDSDVGDTHAASQWQITTTSGDYTSAIYDSGRHASNLTLLTVPTGVLDYSTIYYWRVRHQDNQGNWSEYSAETSFTTLSNGDIVPVPTPDKRFPFYLLGAAFGGVAIIGGSTGYLWRRRRIAATLLPYRQQLRQWEEEGYEVSAFKKKWPSFFRQ